MTRPSDDRLLALHGLRLKGFAEADVVADAVGLDLARAGSLLEALQGEGLVLRRDGRLSGYALTADGRRAHEQLLAAELDQAGLRDDVTHAYKRFLELNADLLAVCTRWQLRDVDGASVVNDHSDPEHDAAVIAELTTLHERVEPICGDLRELFLRYERYGPRLGHALERVRAGDLDFFTKPIIPSYHTVWFELHEDLLATLGLERANEGT